MGRPTKEYHAFTSLVDQLLTVPKEELDRRMVAYKAEADKNPNKRGPKSEKRVKQLAPALPTPPAAKREAGSGLDILATSYRLPPTS